MTDVEGFNEFTLEVAVTVRGGVVKMCLAGELDLFTVEQLRAALQQVCEKRPGKIIIDLSDLTFIDLRGVNTLTDLTRASRQQGIVVELSHQNPALERLAQLLEVDETDLLDEVAEG